MLMKARGDKLGGLVLLKVKTFSSVHFTMDLGQSRQTMKKSAMQQKMRIKF